MYYTYIIRCKDQTLYTGYTSDIQRRMSEHKVGKNSKYTKAKGFGKLEIYFYCNSKSGAMKLESKIKKYNKTRKLGIIQNPYQFIREINSLDDNEIIYYIGDLEVNTYE